MSTDFARRSKGFRAFALGLGLLSLAAPLRAGSILVFAAASMSDALKSAGAAYEKRTGETVEFSFAASNLLAVQISKGAPADVFLSADDKQMDLLAAQGLINKATRRELLSNSLVAVGLAGGPLSVSSAAGLASPEIAHLALADPRAVPAGVYAKKYLEAQGLWDALAAKVLPTGNVRGALEAVVSGNADAAMVYKTDALISKKVRILFEVPVKEGPRIDYPIAVVAASAQPKEAGRFLDFLASKPGLALFKGYGFLVPAAP
ncbi:MAG TPA: molybdate ABC transporter substrate-binding protein [bacterium]|jgi:molybdate transport system substrate-binding protein|nr:molybdate ABC transporter substrate-binding protein [bacterium]